ncbi:acyl-CoA dehydrogenase family protein [Chondromyces crocatus]|uniref:Acyl-CoA dehydrogenase n=1 Tax=Chondromyces crocatus TaxID=52 RepID=A0A0K1EF25_CHOCO|nr:acyl-CoA dehydrogenase family protein [Chondromyces crocatus]AKT39475.1 acyl-CoA dehydrogenase [Chondromyces crocatus]
MKYSPVRLNAEAPCEHPVLAGARAIAQRVAARSEAIAAARRLPSDLVGELVEAGVFRMLVPEVYGGLELHPLVVVEVLEALARAESSTGWCAMSGAVMALSSAWLPEATAAAIHRDRGVIYGGMTVPLGRAELHGGSHTLSGRWPWVSGGEHCPWFVVGAVVTSAGQPRMLRSGAPETRLFVVPRRDVVLHDTWDAAGLRGTGSCDLEITNVRVPAERSFSLLDRPRVDRPLYGMPAFGLLSLGLPAVALGIARRGVEVMKETPLAWPLSGDAQAPPFRASRMAVRAAVTEGEASLRSARALLLKAVSGCFEGAQRREVSLRQRADLRLAYQHATRSAVRSVERLWEVAGGPEVPEAHPLSRCLNDLWVAAQHVAGDGPSAAPLGSTLLGVESQIAFF